MTLLEDVLASLPPERRKLVDSLANAYAEIERLQAKLQDERSRQPAREAVMVAEIERLRVVL